MSRIQHMELRAVIEQAKEDSGLSMDKLTVLAPQHDPFRKDTPAGHRDAQWFASLVVKHYGEKVFHLRGLHYRLVSTPGLTWPDGKLYANTDDDWVSLEEFSKKARWLGYVSFAQIKDERNDTPEWIRHIEDPEPSRQIYSDKLDFPRELIPNLESLLPQISCQGFLPRQAYRIAMIGEKSSLAEELEPLASDYDTDLLLPTGTISDSMLAELVLRAVADGRTLIVLYFSDFDPTGYSMVTETARKLQAHKVLNPELDVQLYAVALTYEQCTSLDLPHSPLKKTEKRAEEWRAAWHRDQTELDARMSLHPGKIKEWAEAAILPFYDTELAKRAEEIRIEWEDEVQERIEQHPTYIKFRDELGEILTEQSTDIAPILLRLRELAEAANSYRQSLHEDLMDDEDVMQELPDVPEPEYNEDEQWGGLVFWTEDEFVEATLRLLERKAYAEGDQNALQLHRVAKREKAAPKPKPASLPVLGQRRSLPPGRP